MKRLALTFGFLLFAGSLYAQGTLSGVWNTGRENTKLEIKEAGAVYTGTVVSSDKPEVVGKSLLKDVKWVGQEWKGQLYVPRLGKWVDATLTQKNATTLSVAVNAGMASRTLEWVKE